MKPCDSFGIKLAALPSPSNAWTKSPNNHPIYVTTSKESWPVPCIQRHFVCPWHFCWKHLQHLQIYLTSHWESILKDKTIGGHRKVCIQLFPYMNSKRHKYQAIRVVSLVKKEGKLRGILVVRNYGPGPGQEAKWNQPTSGQITQDEELKIFLVYKQWCFQNPNPRPKSPHKHLLLPTTACLVSSPSAHCM